MLAILKIAAVALQPNGDVAILPVVNHVFRRISFASCRGSWKAVVLYSSLSPEIQSKSLALYLSYLWNLGTLSCFL